MGKASKNPLMGRNFIAVSPSRFGLDNACGNANEGVPECQASKFDTKLAVQKGHVPDS